MSSGLSSWTQEDSVRLDSSPGRRWAAFVLSLGSRMVTTRWSLCLGSGSEERQVASLFLSEVKFSQ